MSTCTELTPPVERHIQAYVGRPNTLNEVRTWHDLSAEWELERFGNIMDSEQWAERIKPLLNDTGVVLVLAYDGDTPIGMVTFFAWYDPGMLKMCATADRLFVREEYRGGGVFAAMFAALEFLSTVYECEYEIMHCMGEHTGFCLKEFYESKGFSVEGYVMERHK